MAAIAIIAGAYLAWLAHCAVEGYQDAARKAKR